MAPFSQVLEPPPNPGRFSGTNEIVLTNAANDVVMALFQDAAGNTQIATINITTANTAGTIASGDSTVASVVTLIGVDVADFVAGNYNYVA